VRWLKKSLRAQPNQQKKRDGKKIALAGPKTLHGLK
jgi:hypothetical protein